MYDRIMWVSLVSTQYFADGSTKVKRVPELMQGCTGQRRSVSTPNKGT